MGILSKFFGGAVTEPITAVGNILTGVFGTKGEKLNHQEIMARLAQAPNTTQQELQKLDAVSRRGFQSNRRPFIGWICGVGVGVAFIVNPILIWATGDPGPKMTMTELMPLLLALLGLGGLRSVEKMAGKTK